MFANFRSSGMWIISFWFLCWTIFNIQLVDSQGFFPCHPSKASPNSDVKCSRVQVPSGICKKCSLRPTLADGSFEKCNRIYDTTSSQCKTVLKEYIDLNPCDTARKSSYDKMMNNDSEGDTEMDYFLYSICEQCCDCVPMGTQKSDYSKLSPSHSTSNPSLWKEDRGNCPAHARYDVCKVLPHVTYFTKPNGPEISAPEVCPMLVAWDRSAASEQWELNPEVDINSDIKTFLRGLLDSIECSDSQTWAKCYEMENKQHHLDITAEYVDAVDDDKDDDNENDNDDDNDNNNEQDEEKENQSTSNPSPTYTITFTTTSSGSSSTTIANSSNITSTSTSTTTSETDIISSTTTVTAEESMTTIPTFSIDTNAINQPESTIAIEPSTTATATSTATATTTTIPTATMIEPSSTPVADIITPTAPITDTDSNGVNPTPTATPDATNETNGDASSTTTTSTTSTNDAAATTTTTTTTTASSPPTDDSSPTSTSTSTSTSPSTTDNTETTEPSSVNQPNSQSPNENPADTSSGAQGEVPSESSSSSSSSSTPVSGTDSETGPSSNSGSLSSNNDGSSSRECFPHDAIVQLRSGEMIAMRNLKIGDMIRVSENRYSEVYLFSHRISNIQSSFMHIQTNLASLKLTPGHYLQVNNKLTTASTVSIGDWIHTISGMEQVINVSVEQGVGLYNPHTIDGNIVVNNVITSTFTSAVESTTATSLLAPVRALFNSGILTEKNGGWMGENGFQMFSRW